MKIVGIVIALIFALASFLLVYNLVGKEEQPKLVIAEQPKTQTVGVVVAKRNIELGEVITEDSVDSKQWPQHLVLDGFATTEEATANLIGQVARSAFIEGEPINLGRLSNPEDPNFIAANLPSGMRMVTMSSDAVAGLAGFVLPGDRVDIVVTRKHMLEQEEANLTGIREKTVTETLVPNVRVLAVNQRATLQTKSTNDPTQQERDKIPSSVSVEVSLEDAQKIRLAQDMGYVSLALRALSDKDAESQFAITIDKDLTSYVHVPAKKKEEIEKVGVIRGVQRTDIELKKKSEEEEAEMNPEEDAEVDGEPENDSKE
jgi:pilus assembly protein CpaB